MTLPRTSRLRRQRASLVNEFLNHYGGARCVGTCDGSPCPEQTIDPEALTIGHLLNNGRASRQSRGPFKPRGGLSTLRQLKAQGWPQDRGIAPQCANCQLRDLRRMKAK